jgi:hypothetical protein
MQLSLTRVAQSATFVTQLLHHQIVVVMLLLRKMMMMTTSVGNSK